jgi:two-component system, sensor histidine kinase and response regulator
MISKEEIKTVIPKIRENLSNKSNFLNELFIWARSQMEGVTLKQVSLDMRLLIENNHALLQPTADLKEIRLINRVDQSLYVFADEEMVKTVLRNLVSNAIKFTRQGGEVLTSAWPEQDWVTVFVKDNGLGVSPKEVDNLFTPQIHSTTGTDNEVGTGIGLLICKDFVEANGGKIWLEQSDDNGSTFAFTLPTGKAPN